MPDINKANKKHDAFHKGKTGGVYHPKLNPSGCDKFYCLQHFNTVYYYRHFWREEIVELWWKIKIKLGRI